MNQRNKNLISSTSNDKDSGHERRKLMFLYLRCMQTTIVPSCTL